MKIILSFGIPLTVLFLFFLGLNNSSKYNTENLVGNKIDDFEIKSLVEENKIDNTILSKNNFTLINFFASWCIPCREEHPFLLLLNKNSNLKIVGVNYKDKKVNALRFLNELGNPYYIIGKDIDGKVSIKFGVYGIPESILIDKNLKIVKKFIGPINKDDYEKILNEKRKK